MKNGREKITQEKSAREDGAETRDLCVVSDVVVRCKKLRKQRMYKEEKKWEKGTKSMSEEGQVKEGDHQEAL